MVYGVSAIYGHSNSYVHIDHHGGYDGGYDGGHDDYHVRYIFLLLKPFGEQDLDLPVQILILTDLTAAIKFNRFLYIIYRLLPTTNSAMP